MTKATTNEVAESLTGWEELAIKKAFGVTVAAMGMPNGPHQDELLLVRAVGAVVLARQSVTEGEMEGVGEPLRSPLEPMPFLKLYHQVMAMEESKVNDLFAKDEDEAGEPGKDEPLPPSLTLTSSPPSSSSPE